MKTRFEDWPLLMLLMLCTFVQECHVSIEKTYKRTPRQKIEQQQQQSKLMFSIGQITSILTPYLFRPDPDALGLFLMASQLLKLGFDIYAVTPISYLEGPRNVKNECILKVVLQNKYKKNNDKLDFTGTK
jgi:hypothetical protein